MLCKGPRLSAVVLEDTISVPVSVPEVIRLLVEVNGLVPPKSLAPVLFPMMVLRRVKLALKLLIPAPLVVPTAPGEPASPVPLLLLF